MNASLYLNARALAAALFLSALACGQEAGEDETAASGESRAETQYVAMVAPETRYEPPPPPPVIEEAPPAVATRITVDGDAADWEGIPPLIEDEPGNSGRYDIVSVRGAQNADSLFFLIELTRGIAEEFSPQRPSGDIAGIFLDTVYDEPSPGMGASNEFSIRLSSGEADGQPVASYRLREGLSGVLADMDSRTTPDAVAFQDQFVEIHLRDERLKVQSGQVIGVIVVDLNDPSGGTVLHAYESLPQVE